MRKILKKTEPEHFRLWKQRIKLELSREPQYNDLINDSEKEEYKKILHSFLEEQGYICCYCEKAIGRTRKNDCNIEHFMPRNPDRRALSEDDFEKCRNAQLDYDNMMASCLGEEAYSTDHCNHKKDNWFDFSVCISPTESEIENIFGFRNDGKIYAIGSNKKGEELKVHLNLDSYVLREQRKAAYDEVMRMEFEDGELSELWNDDTYIAALIDYYREKDEKGCFTPFCSMITYCLEQEFLR